ncbi:hypothetical protein VPH35_021808 [Triticum aestivum]|uniref:Uncharacterized protein n=1 Tax=Triticum turgidum subsp. durum TaxID=4567 RepID=A0A9R1NXF9_TRITD|nr:unnamed protein product [Triticum turgidum subsp. durum]
MRSETSYTIFSSPNFQSSFSAQIRPQHSLDLQLFVQFFLGLHHRLLLLVSYYMQNAEPKHAHWSAKVDIGGHNIIWSPTMTKILSWSHSAMQRHTKYAIIIWGLPKPSS